MKETKSEESNQIIHEEKISQASARKNNSGTTPSFNFSIVSVLMILATILLINIVRQNGQGQEALQHSATTPSESTQAKSTETPVQQRSESIPEEVQNSRGILSMRYSRLADLFLLPFLAGMVLMAIVSITKTLVDIALLRFNRRS